jgi:hypothetical protein
MNISYEALPPSEDSLTWLENVRAWAQAYEERCMRPAATNITVAAETTRLLLFDVPPAAHPAARVVVSALMDVRLRRAMGFEDPPAWVSKMVDGGFWVRKLLLRYASLPRPWALRKKKVSDEPDESGMLYQIYSVAEPWYVLNWMSRDGLMVTGTSRTVSGTAGRRAVGSSGCLGTQFLLRRFSQEDTERMKLVRRLQKGREWRSMTSLSGD